MNKLDIDGINLSSPYTVAEIRGSLHFRTDHDIEYIVSFDEDSNPYYTAYWFNLTNPNINQVLQYFESEINMFNEQKP